MTCVTAAAYYWFRSREDLPSVPQWNLKHDSPGRWALLGVSKALVLAKLFAGFSYPLLSTVTQLLPRTTIGVDADVLGLRADGSRAMSGRHAEFFAFGERLDSCIIYKTGWPRAPFNLRSGESVTLEGKENGFGMVLIAVKRR
jgi:hypothetical protein